MPVEKSQIGSDVRGVQEGRAYSNMWWTIEVHSVQSTMMGRSQHVGRL